ncbi:hypothetical protein GQ457_04G014860 [Hibiscus cannabinus]
MQERMTLKHKNKLKWVKRILKRGLNAQDEGTRAAMADHALLMKKINIVNDSSSSSTIAVIAVVMRITMFQMMIGHLKDEELPNFEVLSLPFMIRRMKKRKEETMKEAKLALQKYEQLDLEGTNGAVNSKPATSSGRRVFGGRANSEVSNSNKKIKTDDMKMDNYYGNSDSEDDFKVKENINIVGGNDVEKNVCPKYDSKEAIHVSNFDDVEDPGSKTTYDVAIFASLKSVKIENEHDDFRVVQLTT